ncbi:MAG: hypothetical protein WBA43_15575, partial [Elainellaceae cyanobacterium]
MLTPAGLSTDSAIVMIQCFRSLWWRCLRLSLCLILGLIITSAPALSHSISLFGDTRQTLPEIAATPADQLLDRGRQAYAAQRFSEAVAAWEEAAALFSHQPLQQALALSYLTAAYQQLSQWDASDRAITQSLALLATAPDSALKQQTSAQVYNTLGSLQFAQGQTQAALETWQTAADLYAQTGDQSRYFNCLLNQVQAQQSLGYYQRARNTLATLEQRLPEQLLPLQVQGYQRLGQTYRLLGDTEAAQAHLQTALSLAEQENMATGAILLELANTAQGDALGTGGEAIPAAIALYHQAEQSTDAEIRLKARLNRLKLLVHHDPAAAE